MLEDSNYEQKWANRAVEDAYNSNSYEAIVLAEKLQLMSNTQRKKLSRIY
jgi:hypothetical protein